jgi:hypothetical protein
MKKNLFLTMLVLVLVYSLAIGVGAEENINVTVNGELMAFDQPPVIDENNRTLVPLRFISEALGADVSWNGTLSMVTITSNDKEIVLIIGQKKAVVNGENIQFDTAAQLKNGRTLVPVRFISETLDADVNWESGSRTVVIKKEGYTDDVVEEDGVKLTFPIEASNVNEVVRSLDSFKGNTTISRDSLLINLKGSDDFYDNTIAIDPGSERFNYALTITMYQMNTDEKALLKDLLKQIFPKDYEKAYNICLEVDGFVFVEGENIIETQIDGRLFRAYKGNDNQTVAIKIGVKGNE